MLMVYSSVYLSEIYSLLLKLFFGLSYHDVSSYIHPFEGTVSLYWKAHFYTSCKNYFYNYTKSMFHFYEVDKCTVMLRDSIHILRKYITKLFRVKYHNLCN